MSDIKALLREAAIVVRCYADTEYADIELANQLEAAAESLGEPEVSPYSVAVEIKHLQWLRNNLKEASEEAALVVDWINTMLKAAGDSHE